jgi:hypothetical protein
LRPGDSIYIIPEEEQNLWYKQWIFDFYVKLF